MMVAFAVSLAHAEKYYVLTSHLAGQQVIVSSVKMENVPMAMPESDGDYRIEVASQQHEILYSGTYGLASTPTSLYVPYDAEGNYLSIKKSTGEMMQRVSVALFSSVCGDSLCQSSETAQTCRQDCATPEPTAPKENVPKPSATTPKEKPKTAQVESPAPLLSQKSIAVKKAAKKSVGKLVIAGAVLGIVIASGGFLVMLKRSKEQRLEQIRAYLRKYSNYPQDQLKHALLTRGIKEEEIDKALRALS